jgi:hypothetical protein
MLRNTSTNLSIMTSPLISSWNILESSPRPVYSYPRRSLYINGCTWRCKVKPPASRSSPSSSAWGCIPTDPGLADIHASSALHSMVCPILDDALWVQLTAGDVSRYRTTYVCNQYWIQSTSTQSTTLQCPRASRLQLHRLFNVLSARLRLQAKYYTEQGPLRSDAKNA